MGVVFLARQRTLNRPVVLKMLLAGTLVSDADDRRFRQEAEAAANLDHPNIVPIFEVGRHEGHSYFSMKLIEGGSLARKLREFAADQRAAARLIAIVARAVHHAHQRGVLHRDLKPSNILLNGGPDIPIGQLEPYVTDFGLAKRVEGDSELTQSGAILGTPSYMAPEQASGTKGVVTVATDVYGLGAVLYTILAGKPPFHGDSALETIAQVKDRALDPPSRHGRQIHHDLETICLKCLEKEPQRRYSSAENLADDLERWLAGVPILARPASGVEHAWRWYRRNPVIGSLSDAVASLIVLALAGLVISNRMITRERDEAERQRRQAEVNFVRARQAVNDYLTKISEERLLNEPGMQPLRKDLLETALGYYQGFLGKYRDDPALQSEIADTSLRMGRITKMIGARPDALSSCQTALVIYRKLARDDPDRIDFQYGVADSLIKVGDLQYDTGERTEAMTSYREVIALLKRMVRADPNEARFSDRLAKSHRARGDLQNHLGETENGRQSFHRAIAVWQGLLQVTPDVVGFQRELARSLILLGWLSPFDEA
jgi:eukaryotic-like serine/threonine-protein kinase